MQAIILSIGDELVLGQTVDTNSAWLSARLARLGVRTYAHQTVADDQRAIELAIRWAAHHAEFVIVTGGLGPTEDDLTREALAAAMDAELIFDQASFEHIEAFFALRGRKMPKRNNAQARHPAGSTMIDNANGTAPGIRAQVDRAVVFAIPGVPSEMREMFDSEIAPEVRNAAGEARHVILTAKLNTFGKGESDIAHQLRDMMHRGRNPMLGTTVSESIVSVRIRSEFEDVEQAQRELDATVAEVEKRLGPLMFGRDEQTLQESLVALLSERELTVATAESCTGGRIGEMLTDVAGASSVYPGGWCTYSNELKEQQLGVPRELLIEHGAVSGPVVEAMARGAMAGAQTDLAVAVSGVAGPAGGSVDKPVGTVWIGLAWRATEDDAEDMHTAAFHSCLPGSRNVVRDRAAKLALQLLRLHVLDAGFEQLNWAKRVKA